ncbi:MAG: hypothetical protein BGO76_00565 [Caedibacter sp. 38-128]|nr:MAG: hypothetical protein BGO76_00565 [Caedibacter sp. 38-128]
MFKKNILSIMMNNSFEYYQIILFGFFLPLLSSIFFPSSNPNISLMASLLAFASGYLLNPFGGIVFGYLGDKIGRKSTIILSIILSALPTFIIGILPSYERIGIIAPIVLIACRLLQGFSVGGQAYSSVVFVAEQAQKGKINFACSFLAASSLVGALLGTSVGALCTMDIMPKWCWRIPFILGGILGLIGYWAVRKTEETLDYETAKETQQLSDNPIRDVIRYSLKNFLCTIGIAGATLIPFYMISVFAINSSIPLNFNFSISQIMLTNAFFMAMWILFLPLMGMVADRKGSALVMKISTISMLILSFPLCWVIQLSYSLPLTLSCLALLSLLGAGYVAPSGALMAEFFPVALRCSGLSIASGLGSALLGGTAPLIGNLLVQKTGQFSASAFYIMAGSLMGYIALRLARASPSYVANDHQMDIDIPADGLMVTLNKQGYMLSELHEYSQAFVNFAPHAPGPVLDIGASYGVASIPALKMGAKVIANDIESRHLEILKKRVPTSCLGRLELKVGKVPGEVNFAENSLGAVLASGVLHFVSGEELIEALNQIYKWLKPGGKFFLATSTPYTKIFQNFLPYYIARKKSGHPWPGFIENTADYIPSIADMIPKSINLLDKDIVETLVTKVGFKIERISSFSISKIANDINCEGNEILGVIAIKA